MNTIKLQQRGILTLPKKLREALNLTEGQSLRVEQKEGKIILEPQVTMPQELAESIKLSLEDLKKGRYIEFGSSKELHKKLPAFLKKYEN
ncbi:MAG TPA: AbrB/MazE/SpoVT family DNA-binding domain-containing protein [Candidatus Paceibacterota bacterium]|nr:AbrB/MazE/SpoVT family DNA-binding domain-containing protein [Candidatus Paceibacterota bacterium]HMO83078.1 AbrB/MazE/SpoVT family DNA-binding domain-containing protein [Candidatus Paceibacterota bacterium]